MSDKNADEGILIQGKYRLGKRVGRGAFGEIFSGTDIDTSKEIAIKLV